MLNFGNKSRYKTYSSEHYLHKKIPFKNLVSSKRYETFIKETLPNLSYKVTVIPAGLEGRPDLISYATYGSVNYWWLVCLANNIIDPFEDLYAGRQIKLPTI